MSNVKTLAFLQDQIRNLRVALDDAARQLNVPGLASQATSVYQEVRAKSQRVTIRGQTYYVDQDGIAYLESLHAGDGTDRDVTIYQARVTGNPRVYWDESETEFAHPNAHRFDNFVYYTGAIHVETTQGIDYYPGSDTDTDIATIQVTGTPRIYWDEANDRFRFSKGIYVSGSSNRLDGSTSFTGAVEVGTANGVDYNPGSDIDADIVTIGVTGVPRIYWDESEDRFRYTRGIFVGGSTSEFQTLVNFSVGAYVNSANGIDYNPGSDTDADIATVGVTGAPRLYWDESEDRFRLTHGLDVDAYTRLGTDTTDHLAHKTRQYTGTTANAVSTDISFTNAATKVLSVTGFIYYTTGSMWVGPGAGGTVDWYPTLITNDIRIYHGTDLRVESYRLWVTYIA